MEKKVDTSPAEDFRSRHVPLRSWFLKQPVFQGLLMDQKRIKKGGVTDSESRRWVDSFNSKP